MYLMTAIQNIGFPRLAFYYDNLRWRHANKMLNFQGGTWKDAFLAKHDLTIHYTTDLKPVYGDKVTITSDMNGNSEDTDMRSAGAAITILALAHAVESCHEFMSDDQADAAVMLLETVKAGVFNDYSFDHAAIYRIID